MKVITCSGCGAPAGSAWRVDDGSAEEAAFARGFHCSGGLWFCAGYPDCIDDGNKEVNP